MDLPRIPGRKERFTEPDGRLLEFQRMIDTEVQEGAPGLYVFGLPWDIAGTPLFSLVEAWYPEGIRAQYAGKMLDPWRMQDLKEGRLVAVATVGLQGFQRIGEGMGSVYAGYTLDPYHILELRRNNRAARRELKREATASYLAKEIRDRHEQEEQAVYDEFAEQYVDGIVETANFATGKPRVNVLSNIGGFDGKG